MGNKSTGWMFGSLLIIGLMAPIDMRASPISDKASAHASEVISLRSKHEALKKKTATKATEKQHLHHFEPNTQSANPAAVNISPGTGDLQKALLKKLNIKDNHGINFQGAWLGDSNRLLSGGITNAQRTTSNSVLLLNLTLDMEQMKQWKGSEFGAQCLQVNAQNTNYAAGSIQGYNSLPGPLPLNRSELFQIWYRQQLFDNKLFVRVGKSLPSLDFNNVIKPVPLHRGEPTIPAVQGFYIPLFL